MRRRDNLLFYEGDLHGTLENLARQINEKVNAIPKDQFLASPEDDLVEHIFSDLHIEPLELHEDSMEMEQEETEIDVSQNRDRNPFGDRGPIYVQGIKITVSVPFTGEAALLNMRLHAVSMEPLTYQQFPHVLPIFLFLTLLHSILR